MGVMNGLGKQGLLLTNSIVGSVIRILCAYFLIPKFGIPAYIIGMIISSFVVCVLNFITIVRSTGMVLDLRRWVLLPMGVTVILLFSGKYIYSFFDFMKLSSPFQTLLAAGAFVTIDLFLMALVGAINWRELLQLLGLKNKVTRKFKRE